MSIDDFRQGCHCEGITALDETSISNVLTSFPHANLHGGNMNGKVSVLIGLATTVWLYAFAPTAMAADQTTVQITDPNVLVSMGFPADATHVHETMTARTRSIGNADMSADFGPATSYTGVPPKLFIGRQNTAAGPWEYSGGVEGCCANLSRTGPEAFADAPLLLPNGVSLQFVRFWANDSSVSDILFFVFESCFPSFGPGATSYVSIAGSLATTGASGNQSDFAGVFTTINNRDCVYTIRANFGATTGLTLQKFRAQWNRQITPAPVTATFTDVPTTDPFFREVEALAASGITLGCTATQFCPGATLTRLQMAIFLARALGL